MRRVILVAAAGLLAAAVHANDLESRWLTWERDAGRLVELQEPKSALAQLLDEDGEERRSFPLELDESGRPAPPRGGSGAEPPQFGVGANGQAELSELPRIFFEIPWDESRTREVEGRPTVGGIPASGYRLSTGSQGGELWYESETGNLIMTALFPEGGDHPVARVHYVPVTGASDGAAEYEIDRIEMESVQERGLLPNRLQRLTIQY